MAEQIRFTPQQLTGRTRAHVVDLTDPPCCLHFEVVEHLMRLRAAAAEAGFDLVPLSSFRDFKRQLAIWNGKHRGERELRGVDGSLLDARALDDEARVNAILHWSALPGASRHHWGTDIDVIDARALPSGYQPRLVAEEYQPGGVFSGLNVWLTRHAAQFGFFRPYATWRGGVQPEPWHLSHAPVASVAAAAFTVQVLRDALAGVDMEAHAVVEQMLETIVERYVRNIDPPDGAATTCVTRPA